MRSPVHANFGLAESTETSSFPREKGCLLSNTLLQIERVRSKKCVEGALDSLNIRGESRKIILKEEQERDFGEWCVKWG